MPAITREEVAHLAVLARLDLPDDEHLARLGAELDDHPRSRSPRSPRWPPTTSRRRRTRCR